MRPATILRPLILTTAFLLIPLVAARVTPQARWTLFDYLLAGTLVFTLLLAFEWISIRAPITTHNRAGNPNRAWRFGCGLALVTTLLLVWINGAVGIIGDHNPANLLYGAVPVTLILGAALARLRPHGMTRALYITALVQALVPLIALVLWSPGTIAWTPSVPGIFALNTIFVALWLAAAWLFRKAAPGS